MIIFITFLFNSNDVNLLKFQFYFFFQAMYKRMVIDFPFLISISANLLLILSPSYVSLIYDTFGAEMNLEV